MYSPTWALGKYGFTDSNHEYGPIGVHYQLLHAYKLVFPSIEEERFKKLSGLILTCKEPELFEKILMQSESIKGR